MPPGTGDAQLSLSQLIPISGNRGVPLIQADVEGQFLVKYFFVKDCSKSINILYDILTHTFRLLFCACSHKSLQSTQATKIMQVQEYANSFI